MLTRLSRLFNVDFAYLLKGGAVLGIGHTVGVLSGFFLSLIFANMIEVSVYGQYKYILSIAGILGAFTLSGVSTTVLQSVAKGFDGTLLAEQKSYLLWSLISVALSLVVGGYYIIKDDFALGMGVILVTFFSYIYNSITLQGAFLSAKKDFKRLTVNQVLNSLILLGSIYWGVSHGFNTTLWIIVIYFCSQILFQGTTYFHMLRVHKPNSNVDPEDKYLSKHLSLGNIITSIAEYIDKILIFQFLGPTQVAVYAFAVAIPDQIRGINKLLGSLVVPKLSNKDDLSLKKSINAHTKKHIVFSFGVTMLFFLISPYIFKIFFPAYLDTANLASLYMLLLPISAFSTMHGYALQIKRDLKSLYIIRTVDSVGKIVLFVILIPLYGVLGAVSSILIAKLLSTCSQIFLYYYKHLH